MMGILYWDMQAEMKDCRSEKKQGHVWVNNIILKCLNTHSLTEKTELILTTKARSGRKWNQSIWQLCSVIQKHIWYWWKRIGLNGYEVAVFLNMCLCFVISIFQVIIIKISHLGKLIYVLTVLRENWTKHIVSVLIINTLIA